MREPNVQTTNWQIAAALSVFRDLPNETDTAIHAVLVSKGIERRAAARLVELLPIAYGRALLATLGLQFSDEFKRRLPNGQLSESRSLRSEPTWNAVVQFSQQETAGGLSRDALLAVAVRSSEFDSVNKLLNEGSRPKDIRFTAFVLPWTEDGPP